MERLRVRPHGLVPEAEDLALILAERRPRAGPPEYTVMIDTAWPSSRRLAISPPQERATSSGCGAMKTWVIAAEDSIGRPSASLSDDRAGSALVAVLPDQWDEDAGVERLSLRLVARPPHDRQHL